jgi:murein L,D-transpeptidase YafK
MPARLSRPRIVVDKRARTLELYDGNTLYGRYPVALGFAPVGYKQREGDGKTPEGEYYVCVKNPNSSFHLSLGVSYPNAEDAARGLASGLIDKATHERIKAAIAARRCPPWNTALGGEIMIHGSGSQSDWTFGCIAVENDVMDILFRVCPLGTAIKINP